jgi:hypothetical protein
MARIDAQAMPMPTSEMISNLGSRMMRKLK